MQNLFTMLMWTTSRMAVKIVTNDWIFYFLMRLVLTGIAVSLDQRTAADRLLGYGLELIIVTLAEKGCEVYSKDEIISFSGF